MDHEQDRPEFDATDAEVMPDEVTIDDAADDETPDEPAPPPPPDVPVAGGDRIHSLDVLRGFAVLGILLINMWTFALPFPAALNPNLVGFDQGMERVAHGIVHMVGNTKMFPIFSMLFGAGILLFTGRVEARGGRSGRRWFSRQFWLWVIGLVHGYLLWTGDILVPYAIVGLILYKFRRLRPRTLVIVAVVFLIIPKAGMFGLGEGMKYVRDQAIEAQALQEDGEELTDQQEQFLEIWTENGKAWDPSQEDIDEKAAVMRGSYPGIVKQGATELITLHLFLYPFIANWSIAGFMLIGMALFKTGVLQGERSDGFYVKMAIICYGIGLPGAWWARMLQDSSFGDMIAMMQGGMAVGETSGPLVALGHIALVVLAVRRGWLGGLEARLAAAGRMAFTNYLSQTVIGVVLFFGFGFGLWGTVGRMPLLGITVAVWVVQLMWSPWWLARFRFGPAEWLWRSLTYGKKQGMKRVVEPEAV